MRLIEAIESTLAVTGQFSLCLLYGMLTPVGAFLSVPDRLRSLLGMRPACQLLSLPNQSSQESSKQQSNSFKTCLAKRKVGLFCFELGWQGLKQ